MTSKANAISHPCRQCPLREQETFRSFSEEELRFVQTFKIGELVVEPGGTLFLEGTNSAHVYTMLSGWAFRYKLLDDGRRQILNFALPGDFLGLQSAVLDEMEHSVEVLSRSRLCVFPRERLWELYEQYPSLAFDITWLASREECLLHEHLLSVGRRTAVEKIAYLLLHLYARARQVQKVRGKRIDFPLTQQHVADALGLSMVHTNRTLRNLHKGGMIDWSHRKLEILDMDKMTALVGAEAVEETRRPLI